MNINNSTSPLISIVVATYNSSSTVIETLESIKEQTYQNLELIISDDCSVDNTTLLCQEWLNVNDERFVYSELVTTDHNTGVAGNFNRGIRHSRGEWIKSIAGDDLLVPTAIVEYMKFIQSHSEKVRMCVCDVECFSTDGEVSEKYKKAYARYFEHSKVSFEQQRNEICYKCFFVGPSYFYSRELFNEVGGFSENYNMSEEWPFCYKVIMLGNRIFAIEEKLVKYRVASSSLSHDRNQNGLVNYKLFKSLYQFYFDYPYHDLLGERRYLAAFHYATHFWTLNYCYRTGNGRLARCLHNCYVFFSPYSYMKRLKLVR